MDRGGFYRLCRMLHAYLSAFAFLTLIFFALSGLLLDHPDWLQGRPKDRSAKLTLPPSALAAAGRSPEPARTLAAVVARMTPLVGAYRSGEIDDGEADLRFEGVKGSSTAQVDMTTGATDVAIERASFTSVIEDLHRGKNAGPAWRLVIDVSAVLLLALSAIGYVLFFSLRFRLGTSLVLTALSIVLMLGVVLLSTP
jgi:uncharacterized protein